MSKEEVKPVEQLAEDYANSIDGRGCAVWDALKKGFIAGYQLGEKSVSGLEFKDSHGNTVKDGDEIRIGHHYSLQNVNGKKAVVFWDGEKGMFKWRLIHDKRFCQDENFYGVHSFEKLGETKQ